MHPVITISREYGSGGREIGLLVAKKMNVPFYDKELIAQTAQNGFFSPEILREYEERIASAPSVFYQTRNIVSFYHQPLSTRNWPRKAPASSLGAVRTMPCLGTASAYLSMRI